MAMNRNDTSFSDSGSSDTGQNSPVDVNQVADQTKEQAGQLLDQARQQAFSQIDNQKKQVAQSLGSIADALHSTGKQLRDKDQEPVANFIEQAADQVTRFSTQLSERDIEQQLAEVQRFARSQPALFLGGAFFLGLMAARFFKPPENFSLMGTESSGARWTGPNYRPDYSRNWSGSSSGTVGARTGYGSSSSKGWSSGSSGSYGQYTPRTEHNVHDNPSSSNKPMIGRRTEWREGMPANEGASIEPGVQPIGDRTGRASNLEK